MTRPDLGPVNMGGALGLVITAALASGGLFVYPLEISWKAYAFVVLVALVWGILNLSVEGETQEGVRLAGVACAVVLGALHGAICWCWYWFDGGNDPFFYDITLIYIAWLVPVAMFVGGGALLDYFEEVPTRNTLADLRDSLWFWLQGYGALWGLIFILLICIEGD